MWHTVIKLLAHVHNVDLCVDLVRAFWTRNEFSLPTNLRLLCCGLASTSFPKDLITSLELFQDVGSGSCGDAMVFRPMYSKALPEFPSLTRLKFVVSLSSIVNEMGFVDNLLDFHSGMLAEALPELKQLQSVKYVFPFNESHNELGKDDGTPGDWEGRRPHFFWDVSSTMKDQARDHASTDELKAQIEALEFNCVVKAKK